MKLKSLLRDYLKVTPDREVSVVKNNPASDDTYMISTEYLSPLFVKGRTFVGYVLKTRHPFTGDPFSKEEQNLARVTVKHPADIKSENEVGKLIIDSFYRMDRYINRNAVDTIIPIASSSSLNDKICNLLHRFCKNSVYLDNTLEKATWRDVKLNEEILKKEKAKSREQAEEFLKQKQRETPDDEFRSKQIGYAGGMGFRRYFIDFLKINLKHRKKEEYEKLITGKNVLIVDDTYEEGATESEAIRQIKKFKPASIKVYIFLYTQKTSAPKKETDDERKAKNAKVQREKDKAKQKMMWIK